MLVSGIGLLVRSQEEEPPRGQVSTLLLIFYLGRVVEEDEHPQEAAPGYEPWNGSPMRNCRTLDLGPLFKQFVKEFALDGPNFRAADLGAVLRPRVADVLVLYQSQGLLGLSARFATSKTDTQCGGNWGRSPTNGFPGALQYTSPAADLC